MMGTIARNNSETRATMFDSMTPAGHKRRVKMSAAAMSGGTVSTRMIFAMLFVVELMLRLRKCLLFIDYLSSSCIILTIEG